MPNAEVPEPEPKTELVLVLSVAPNANAGLLSVCPNAGALVTPKVLGAGVALPKAGALLLKPELEAAVVENALDVPNVLAVVVAEPPNGLGFAGLFDPKLKVGADVLVPNPDVVLAIVVVVLLNGLPLP